MPAVASPTVTRAAHVLKALAAGPEAALSLSEVARRVQLNRASCQTLLLALVAEGLVTRTEPGPSYRLGPALIPLGDAARASFDVAEVAGPHLDALHRRFNATAMAGVMAGDEVVVTAVRASPHPFGLTVATGGRTPLRAPIGPVYLAWASSSAVHAWIERADPPLSRTRAAQVRRDLAAIRSRGYSVTVRGARRREGALDHEELTEDRPRDQAVRVVGISAAAWAVTGDLACTLALTGFAGSMTRAEITAAGRAARDAALDLTRSLGGQPPSHPTEGDPA